MTDMNWRVLKKAYAEECVILIYARNDYTSVFFIPGYERFRYGQNFNCLCHCQISISRSHRIPESDTFGFLLAAMINQYLAK